MDWVARLAEERIRRAREEGTLSSSRYHGRRVPLEPENPYLPKTWWAAFHLLQTHDLTPPWIWRGQQIRQAIAAWRRQLRQTLAYIPAHDPRRAQALRSLQQSLARINAFIRDYNLERPFGSTPLTPLDWEAELRQAQQEMA
ncbi:MAG: DUF1992 domain-containing protein [Chloroflexi bacterium]|nr:DUF1992 domain-containing protein [Chloroflexota bacterium]